MHENLEIFRKRLRESEKEKINWQFWIGSPTAWLALIVSASTAFYTFLYHSDELSVAMPPPSLEWNGDREISVQAPSHITFINTGSRPIAVVGIDLQLVQASSSTDKPRCRYAVSLWNLDFEQTIVRPYDAVTKALKLPRKQSDDKEKIDLENGNEKRVFATCARFTIISADATGWVKTIDLGLITLESIGMTEWEDKSAERPPYLIKRNRFWTDMDRDPPLFPYRPPIIICPNFVCP